MWEHYDDLPFEVFCVDSQGVKHLLKRHRLESEAIHSMNIQNRSGGYAAEYWDWRLVELSKGSSNMVTHVDAVLPQVTALTFEEAVVVIDKMRAGLPGNPLNNPSELKIMGIHPDMPQEPAEPEPAVTIGKSREVKCMLCNDCGTAQGCPGCQRIDPLS